VPKTTHYARSLRRIRLLIHLHFTGLQTDWQPITNLTSLFVEHNQCSYSGIFALQQNAAYYSRDSGRCPCRSCGLLALRYFNDALRDNQYVTKLQQVQMVGTLKRNLCTELIVFKQD